MKVAPRMLRSLLFVYLILLVNCTFAHRAPASSRQAIPRTVDQAAEALMSQRLPKEDLDWILRNPKDSVVDSLHLPFGTQVRNSWKLWGENKDLLASCGVDDAEACSGIIFERLWERVREDADPLLVKRLDCQFQLIEEAQINYKGFYSLRIGEVLQSVQSQIDRQLDGLTGRLQLPPDCPATLRLRVTGDPDLNCWARVEFSEDGHDPVALERLLGWISWRNGFDVLHSPPAIEVRFRDKCAWPEAPTHFLPIAIDTPRYRE